MSQIRRYRVRGRVQGVAFRAFVRKNALSLGLDGWVRNRVDGSVEVMASGPTASLDDLRRLLEKGSRWSRVDNIEEESLPDSALDHEPGGQTPGLLQGFSVLRTE